MSVKIYGSTYLSGMPTLEYKIVINDVGISLSKDDFTELLSSLSEKLKKDYEAAKKEKDNYDKQVQIIHEIKRELLQMFYDGDINDIDSMFFKKVVTGINEEQLNSFLKKYNRFMGLE